MDVTPFFIQSDESSRLIWAFRFMGWQEAEARSSSEAQRNAEAPDDLEALNVGQTLAGDDIAPPISQLEILRD